MTNPARPADAIEAKEALIREKDARILNLNNDLSNERSEFAADLRKRLKILQRIQDAGSACPGAVVDAKCC